MLPLHRSARGGSGLLAAVRKSAAATPARAIAGRLASSTVRVSSACPARTLAPALAARFFSFSTPSRQVAEARLEEAQMQESVPEAAAPTGPATTFQGLKSVMDSSTWKALTGKPFGYTDMSEVQARVLALLPEIANARTTSTEDEEARAAILKPVPDGRGSDMLVKARTGTGKTLAFLVPAIEARVKAIDNALNGHVSVPFARLLKQYRPDLDITSLDKAERQNLARQLRQNTVGTLVLSPTRELATQIAAEAQKLHTHHKDMKVQLLVGGASKRDQLSDWRRWTPDVVVATPGRILDLAETSGMVKEALKATGTLILDEADTLLEMGFRDDLKRILDHLPSKSERLTMLFSATVSRDIKDIAQASLQSPHRFVDCVPPGEENVHKHIPQFATVVPSPAGQIPHLVRLIAHDQMINAGKSKVIVFCPTTKMTQLVADVLRQLRNILPVNKEIYDIHSKKDQSQRFRTSDRFRRDKSGGAILVTSDVSARGVDYPGTTRVIQIGVPSSPDQYIHRIGRTGRAGAQGRSDIILLPWESGYVSHTLKDLNLQRLSTTDLATELQSLLARFDEEPASVIPQDMLDQMHAASHSPRRDQRRIRGAAPTPDRPVPIIGPLSQKLTPEAIAEALERGMTSNPDVQDSVREVAAGFLGYYVNLASDLRVQKADILAGIKQWTVLAGGLPEPPFFSDSFLTKIGFSSATRQSRDGGGRSGGGRGGFGNRGSGGGSFRPWEGRGSRKSRESRDFGDRSGGSFRDGDSGGFRDRRDGGFRDRSIGGYGGRSSGGRDSFRSRDDGAPRFGA